MLNVRRTALAAVLAAAIAIPVAWAAGTFSMWPIVGGASYCAGLIGQTPAVGGITGQGAGSTTCAQTVPAGPPSLTGAETFPADTNQTGGAPPATALVTACQLGAGSLRIISPAAGSTSATIANQVCYYVIGGSSTVSAYTLTMPSAPLDGQIFRLSSKPAVTTLTMSAAAGQTLNGAATSASANSAVGAWIYQASDTSWYRTQ